MYLTGTYRHNLDAKSRVTLPAPLRKQFGDQVCLVPVQDAIYGFTPEGHHAWVNSYFPNGFDPRSKRDVRLQRALNASSVTIDIDSAGRIALGKMDAEALGRRGIEVGRSVVVVGNNDHFEIWDAERYDQEMAELQGDLDDLMFDD